MSAEEQAPPTQEAPSASGGGVTQVSKRVSAILDAVEEEAARLREEARAEAAGYLDDARRRADQLVADRQRLIGELSDELVAKTEAVVARLDDAAPVRRGFENLVRALGAAAERLAREAEDGAAGFQPPPFGAASAQPSPAQRPPADPTARVVADPAPGPPAAGPRSDTGTRPARPYPARAPAAPSWRGLGGGPATAPAGREGQEMRVVAIQMATAGATRGDVREHLQHAFGRSGAEDALDAVFGRGSGEDARAPWAADSR